MGAFTTDSCFFCQDKIELMYWCTDCTEKGFFHCLDCCPNITSTFTDQNRELFFAGLIVLTEIHLETRAAIDKRISLISLQSPRRVVRQNRIQFNLQNENDLRFRLIRKVLARNIRTLTKRESISNTPPSVGLNEN